LIDQITSITVATAWHYKAVLLRTNEATVSSNFSRSFGGGPAVNHLSVCQTCQLEAERLQKRQLYEREEFIRVN
jgi:hypothetical protein